MVRRGNCGEECTHSRRAVPQLSRSVVAGGMCGVTHMPSSTPRRTCGHAAAPYGKNRMCASSLSVKSLLRSVRFTAKLRTRVEELSTVVVVLSLVRVYKHVHVNSDSVTRMSTIRIMSLHGSVFETSTIFRRLHCIVSKYSRPLHT